jgi:two-component system chemotaxis sensor kinase CheA
MDAILLSVDKLKTMVDMVKQNQAIDSIDIEQEIQRLLSAQESNSQAQVEQQVEPTPKEPNI